MGTSAEELSNSTKNVVTAALNKDALTYGCETRTDGFVLIRDLIEKIPGLENMTEDEISNFVHMSPDSVLEVQIDGVSGRLMIRSLDSEIPGVDLDKEPVTILPPAVTSTELDVAEMPKNTDVARASAKLTLAKEMSAGVVRPRMTGNAILAVDEAGVVRLVPARQSTAASSGGKGDQTTPAWSIGDKVEAFDETQKTWLPAEIRETKENGWILKVAFDDMDEDSGKWFTGSNVRKPSEVV